MRLRLALVLAPAILFAPSLLAPAQAASASKADDARYSLANGCYALRARAPGRFAAKSGAGYSAAAGAVGAAEPFRMKATALGRYLLYGRQGDYLAATAQNGVESATKVSSLADWKLEDAGSGGFRLVLAAAGNRVLAATGAGGALVLAERGAAGNNGIFTFERAGGCATFPEIEVSASGLPRKGSTSYTETAGLVDAHIHMMAFEFLGGRAHCGRPWHPYGVEQAMVDCPDHYPGNGSAAVLENVLFGNPARTHDPVGWPTFKEWPHHASLTHEQTYYRWLERAWLGGLRVYVNLLVENAALCDTYPYKKNSCNEMNSVRLQARRLRELEDYIDAQSGGPGKGFFRVVTDPHEARRVINDGKLAVVIGIEVSELFDCQVYNDVPKCDKKQIDRQLDEVYKLGVRDMELVNKFDNALSGVAGDNGTTGVVVNAANKRQTGKFWHMETCSDGHPHVHDREQLTLEGSERDALVGNGLRAFLPPGTAPLYPKPPHCNTRGLSDLGEHLVRRMIAKRMIIDPDHMSVRARNQLLSVVEAARYSGIVSSHSWSSPDALPRIYKLGGFVTPYAGSSTGFVKEWRETRPMRSSRHYFGFGYGADMNGFGAQGPPRNGANPVSYPFKSFDGSVTLFRQKSGFREFDINKDGVAHYGLYPDWIEDLRKIAGDQIVKDMSRGSEAYLQMWERAEGVPAQACRSARGRFTRRGLGRARVGLSTPAFLRRAGQPAVRRGRVYRYCVTGPRNRRAKVVTVFTRGERAGLVASTAGGHTALKVGKGDRSKRLRGKVRRLGRGLLVRRAGSRRIVYGVRKGRVRYVAVAAKSVASSRKRLRAYLRLAGLR